VQIVEFAGTLRFLDRCRSQAPEDGFVWIYLEREHLEPNCPCCRRRAALGGSPLLDLHVKDLEQRAHPSHYDYTSVYDLVIFRRLATEPEVQTGTGDPRVPKGKARRCWRASAASARAPSASWCSTGCWSPCIPEGCFAARSFIERYLSDAVQAKA
jgi:magnesium transporter